MGILKLPDGRFRVQIRRKGFPRFDHVYDTRSDAEAAQDAALRQMSEPVPGAADLTLNEAWNRYRESSQFFDKALRTQRTEEGRIKPVLQHLGGYSLSNLAERPYLLQDYIDSRRKLVSEKTRRKLSPTSVRLEVAALSAVAIWAVERRLILKNFVNDIKRPVQTKRKRRVPLLEQGRLELAVVQQSDAVIAEGARFLLLMRMLGCRPGELASLLRVDIRFAQHDVTFRNTKFEGENRLVHVTDKARQWLDAQYQYAKQHAPDSPYLFSTRARKGRELASWKPYNYAWPVRRLKEAGVIDSDFHAHAMRREFISRAIEGGLPYATIRKQTGHHSTQAIEIYDEGLSTAPEIRAALDAHDRVVQNESLEGLMSAAGISPEQIREYLNRIEKSSPSPVQRAHANGEVIPIRKHKGKR